MPSTAAETLRFIRETPLTFGPWRTFKSLYKQLEADPSANPELLGNFIARLDNQPLHTTTTPSPIALGRVRSILHTAVSGDRLAMVYDQSYNNPQLAIYDFSGPDKLKPKKLSSLKLESGRGKQVDQLLWCGPLVVVRQGETIQLYEEERQELKRLATLSTLKALSVGAAFPYLFVVMEDSLRIVDLRNITAPGVGVEVRGAVSVTLGDGFAAVLCASTGFRWNRLPSAAGIKIVDLSAISEPKVVASLSLAHAIKTITIDGRRAYAITQAQQYGGPQTLHTIDLSSLQSPRPTATLDLGGHYRNLSLAAQNHFVYIGDGSMQLTVVSAREPETLKIERRVTASYTTSIAISGESLYASAWSELTLWNLAHPERPTRYGSPPSAATLGYLKRRARRHLKTLAKTDPERFLQTAFHTLCQTPTALSGERHWVALDILCGGSGRYTQTSHGRGHLKEISPRTLSIRRRDERAPELWNAAPELATRLYAAPNIAWLARELGAKALHAAKKPLPTLTDDALQSALEAPSLVLIAAAVRQVLMSETITPETAALAFTKAATRQRRLLVEKIVQLAQSNAAWNVAFTEAVLAVTPPIGKRFTATAELLATYFTESVRGTALIRLVPGLLRSEDSALRALALRAAEEVDEGTLGAWLRVLVGQSASDQEALLVAMERGVALRELGEPWELVEASDPIIRDAVWRVLAASATSRENLRALWDELFLASEVNEALQTAMQSSHALTTLGRAGFTADEMATLLASRPFLVGLLTRQAFTALTQTLPAATTLRLIAAADDGAWGRLRDGWIRNLREGIGILDLWTALPKALQEDTTGNLERRVLSDTAIVEALLTETNGAVLFTLHEPALGPLLGRWLVRHWPQVETDESLLLTAATHPLADLRTAALEIVGRRTLHLAFAIRLLECEIPASVVMGKRWFESSDTVALMTRALALADSPLASVRRYAQSFITAHVASLDVAALCTALYENDAPEMQAFAATLAGDSPAPHFDRAVLRSRHRSRHAKETVKARQERATTEGYVDVATLLALARGTKTPRDAEWALAQLTKRALAGEKIDGLEIG